MWLLTAALPARADAPAGVRGAPTFDETELQSDNGVAQLSWADVAAGYEVELSGPDMPDRIVYRGHLPSAHVSGLRDGSYRARVRAKVEGGGWSGWSGPAAISVTHHSMQLVWGLLAIGALTFLATAGVLVISARREPS